METIFKAARFVELTVLSKEHINMFISVSNSTLQYP